VTTKMCHYSRRPLHFTTAVSNDDKVGAIPKILLGVVLPLVVFFANMGLLFELERSKGPEWGISGIVKFWMVYVPGMPTIVVLNSLLMVLRWRRKLVVCSLGLILPSLLVIIECCLLAFWH